MKKYVNNNTGTVNSGDNLQGRFIDRFDVLLLDMGNTFMFGADRFDSSDNPYKTYLEFGGKSLNSEKVSQILRDVFLELLADGKIPENYEKPRPVSGYLKRHPFAASIPLDELDLLGKVFTEHEIGTIPEKYIDIIKQLSTTHRLGIVSDIWSQSDRFYQELEKAGIREYFEVIVFSSDIGIIKPSPKIFFKALEAMDTDISKVVYIGDSFRRDVIGAKNFGISVIWINNGKQTNTMTEIQPDLTISDLQDVLEASRILDH
ncbi:HAD family hydrolase [Bacteroidota bacterium]